jgi:hypothetical protein
MFGITEMFLSVEDIQYQWIYPLVNIQTAVKITMLLVGKSTMSTGPFSIANC